MPYSETISQIFEGIPTRFKVLLAALITFALTFVFTSKDFFGFLDKSRDREFQILLLDINLKQRLQRYEDSIQLEKDKIKSEQFIYKNGRINDIMYRLERSIKCASSISIYSIHNGGGIPKTGSSKKLSVLYTQDNVKGVDILKEYGGSGFELTSGYAAYSERLLRARGENYYVADVKKDSTIYENHTAIMLDRHQTKALYGAWIKTGPRATYYINISFDIASPLNNYKEHQISEMLRIARQDLIELLDVEEISSNLKTH